MNRQEFQQVAELRLEDSRSLLNNSRYSGAYYLAGYAVECALKAGIARQTKEHDFPPKVKDVAKLYVHELSALRQSAGLELDYKVEAKADPAFEAYWTLLKDWSEEARYRTFSPQQALEILTAVEDTQHGVLQWLKRYW